MKKLLSLLLILCLFTPCAIAGWENEPYYFVSSVTNCYYNDKAYTDFYNAGEFSVIIPGCSQDFVPQGISYYAPQDLIIFSGYSSFGLPSSLMAVDRSTNQLVKQIFLALPNGEEYTGHAGGVCVTGKNIYVSDDDRLYRMSLATFLGADNACLYNFEEVISVPCTASFCQYNNGILWVGEFERTTSNAKEKQYRTDASHHIQTVGGENTGWILGYQLTGATENEFAPGSITKNGAIPNYILSTTDRIQGFTISNGMIYLSQSYGRKNDSTIYRHRNVLNEKAHVTANVYGAKVPVWILNKGTETASLTCPPMTEGLCTINDKVYISFESAAPKYRIPLDNGKPAKNPVDRIFQLNTF